MDLSHDNIDERIPLLRAMLAAAERRSEVMAAIGDATSDHEARTAVRSLLLIDDMAARAVLEMQLRRFSHQARDHLRTELDQLLSQGNRD